MLESSSHPTASACALQECRQQSELRAFCPHPRSECTAFVFCSLQQYVPLYQLLPKFAENLLPLARRLAETGGAVSSSTPGSRTCGVPRLRDYYRKGTQYVTENHQGLYYQRYVTRASGSHGKPKHLLHNGCGGGFRWG